MSEATAHKRIRAGRAGHERFIAFHHKEPYARGGKHGAGNIELRCRAHNQYEAERDYGELFMTAKRQERLRA